MLLILIIWIIIKKKSMTMSKRNMPVIHPGELLKAELIEATGLTVTEVASMLKVSRQAVSSIINEKADISPEMALRIATVFGGTPDIWLRLQAKYDLTIAAKKINNFKLMPYQHKRA
jgi:addiction module HigA family antidote